MHRLACAGLLSAVLALVSCFSGAGQADAGQAAGDASRGVPGAGAVPPIDRRSPAITQTATFALG